MEQWLNAGAVGVVAAAVAAAVARPRFVPAAWRCRLWGAALLGLAAPFAALLLVPLAGRILLTVRTPSAGAALPASAAPAPLIAVPDLALPVTAVLVAWGIVFSWRVVILVRAVVRVRMARARAVPLAPATAAQFTRWTEANQGRFALVASDAVAGASMLGLGHPVVSLPPAWLATLPAADLDAVLLHELAHAERRDDLAQLGQQLLLAACWFHPLAWWINARIEFEREAACDERAARATGLAGYAGCLVRIAEAVREVPSAPALLVASSAARPGQLVRRVAEVLRLGDRRGARSWTASWTLAALAGAAAASGADIPPLFGKPMLPVEAAVSTPAVLQEEGMPQRPTAPAIQKRATSPARNEPTSRTSVTAPPVLGATVTPSSLTPPILDAQSIPDAPPGPEGPVLEARGSIDMQRVQAAIDAAPSGGAANTAGQTRSLPAEKAPGLGAPFAGLGARLAKAGKRTGDWFSRAGTRVAAAVTPR